MKGQLLCSISIFLHIMNLLCVTGRPFASNHDHADYLGKDHQHPKSLQIIISSSHEGKNSKLGVEEFKKVEEYKEVNKIGSSPPSCAHKCFGCMPCEAIQVPTTSSRVGVQYTNYEPEGWRCKCGPTFYTP